MTIGRNVVLAMFEYLKGRIRPVLDYLQSNERLQHLITKDQTLNHHLLCIMTQNCSPAPWACLPSLLPRRCRVAGSSARDELPGT